jgi:hypothetical protein
MSRHPNSKLPYVPKKADNEAQRQYSNSPGPSRFVREPMPQAWIEDARRRRRAQ